MNSPSRAKVRSSPFELLEAEDAIIIKVYGLEGLNIVIRVVVKVVVVIWVVVVRVCLDVVAESELGDLDLRPERERERE